MVMSNSNMRKFWHIEKSHYKTRGKYEVTSRAMQERLYFLTFDRNEYRL